MLKYLKLFSVYGMGFFYIAVGIQHFTNPYWFVKIVPPLLPYKLALVYISGILEVILGGLLMFKRTRYLAGIWADNSFNCCLPRKYIFSINQWSSFKHNTIDCLGKATVSICFHRSCILAYAKLSKYSVLVFWTWA